MNQRVKRNHKSYSQQEDNYNSPLMDDYIDLQVYENSNSEDLINNQNIMKLGVKLLKNFFKIINGGKKSQEIRVSKIKKPKSQPAIIKNNKKPKATKYKSSNVPK